MVRLTDCKSFINIIIDYWKVKIKHSGVFIVLGVQSHCVSSHYFFNDHTFSKVMENVPNSEISWQNTANLWLCSNIPVT